MKTSEKMDQLAAALAVAQGEIGGAIRDAVNPYFKSRYADLASCWEACRQQLSKHGLAVIQSPRVTQEAIPEGKESRSRCWQYVTVETLLIHSSGQWVSDEITLLCNDDTPQAAGSGITYARRYGLCAMVGIAPTDEDDDGHAASHPPPAQATRQQAKPRKSPNVSAWVDEYAKAVDESATEAQLLIAEDNARAHYERSSKAELSQVQERLLAIKVVKENRRKQFVVDGLIEAYGTDAYAEACGGKALDDLTLADVQEIAKRMKE